jgi:lipoyl(octanoyl) transferase
VPGGLPDSRPDADDRPLQAFLLGTLDLDALIALQRRLVYEVAGDGTPAVVLCDHPPGISIGRDGSRGHVRPSPEVLAARRWPVKWVSRGGGCLLHLPGQVACYPILPLQELGTTPGRYIDSLNRIAADTVREFGAEGEPLTGEPGVRVTGRRIAHVGVAVRDWVSSFGITVNVNPDLDPFREVRCDGDPLPMTSLQRESPARVRVPGVRQSLLEGVARRFGFTRVSVFHTHPTFLPKPTRHAFAPRSR